MNVKLIRIGASILGPTPAVLPCRVVIPSFVELSSDKSELTFFFFLVYFFLAIVDLLEQYNLHLSAKFHIFENQVSQTRHKEYLEQEEHEKQLV